jgi:hypothetical protein
MLRSDLFFSRIFFVFLILSHNRIELDPSETVIGEAGG